MLFIFVTITLLWIERLFAVLALSIIINNASVALPRELAKHAVSKGTKGVTKFTSAWVRYFLWINFNGVCWHYLCYGNLNTILWVLGFIFFSSLIQGPWFDLLFFVSFKPFSNLFCFNWGILVEGIWIL